MDHKNNIKTHSGINSSKLRSALFALGIGICTPFVAQALSLGDISTKSYLNQPLIFHIPVALGKGERVNTENMVVRLASSDEYQRQGLVYPWGLGDINLSVAKKGGKLVISGSSAKPVRDLIVFLLLKVEWPGGTVFKEYSALIDVDGAAKAPVVINRQAGTTVKKSPKADIGTPPQNVAPTAMTFSSSGADITALDGAAYNDESAALPQAAKPAKKAQRHFAGFGSDKDYRDYKVKAGDSLSVIAQQLRGSVKLPLHHYIGAITEANKAAFSNGLSNLEVGQVIKIPNPNLVASTYSQKSRRLENTSDGASQYRVKYGDSLFLIAKAFHPEGVNEQDYIKSLREHNPSLASGSFLEPGIVLTIPNPSEIAKSAASDAPASSAETEAAPQPTEPAESAEQPFIVEALNTDSDIDFDSKPAAPASEEAPAPETAIEQQLADKLDASLEQSLEAAPEITQDDTPPVITEADSKVVVAPLIDALPTQKLDDTASSDADSLLPEGDAVPDFTPERPLLDPQEQIIPSDDNNIADAQLADAALVAKNNQMQQELSTLNDKLASMEVNLSTLKQQNSSLNAEIVEFNEQQQAPEKSNNFILMGLGVLAALLAALCLLFFSKMQQLARRAAGASNHNNPVITENAPKSGLLGGIFGSKKEESQAPVSGEKDYSNYDFSKSNYDYSQLYDIEKLKEDIKSTGSSAFVQSGNTIQLEDGEDDIDTVREFIDSKHFEVADKLLAKMRDEEPENLEYQLTWLELNIKRGMGSEANIIQEELKKQFPDFEDEIDKTVSKAQQWLDEQPAEEVQQGIFQGLADEAAQSQEGAAEQPAAEDEAPAPLDEFEQSEEDERLYEVQVYMSYGHDEMAHNSLEEYLQDNPGCIKALLLKLELYLRGDNPVSAVLLAEQIKQNHDLSDEELQEVDGLVAAAKRSISQNQQKSEAVQKEDSELDEVNAMLSQEGDDSDLTALIDDDKTQLLDSDKTQLLDSDKTQLLDSEQTQLLSPLSASFNVEELNVDSDLNAEDAFADSGENSADEGNTSAITQVTDVAEDAAELADAQALEDMSLDDLSAELDAASFDDADFAAVESEEDMLGEDLADFDDELSADDLAREKALEEETQTLIDELDSLGNFDLDDIDNAEEPLDPSKLK